MAQHLKEESEQFDQLLLQALQERAQQEDRYFASLLDAQMDPLQAGLGAEEPERELPPEQLDSPAAPRSVCRLFKRIRKWGVALAAVFVLVCMLPLVSDASIVDFFRGIFHPADTYISLEEAERMAEQCRVEIIGKGGWNAFYFPQNLPSEFEIQKIQADKKTCLIQFYRADGQATIQFFQYPLAKSAVLAAQYDNEDLKVLKKITIEGNEGLLIQKEDRVLIAFDNNDCYFEVICTKLDGDTVVKLCQNFKKVSK